MGDLLDVLGVDRRHVAPRYVGPPLRTFEDGSYERGIFGGPRKKDIPAPGGGIIETPIYFPWGDIESADDLRDRYGTMGDMSWWDFASIPDQIDKLANAAGIIFYKKEGFFDLMANIYISETFC